ncbi:hypothetical protein V3481_005117 [Fusarium oxysporum f. sp. vasinfectum]
MDKILDSMRMIPSASYPPNVSCTLQLQQTNDETCPLRERTNVDIQSIGVNYLFLENVRDDRDTRRSIYLCTLWLFVSASNERHLGYAWFGGSVQFVARVCK